MLQQTSATAAERAQVSVLPMPAGAANRVVSVFIVAIAIGLAHAPRQCRLLS